MAEENNLGGRTPWYHYEHRIGFRKSGQVPKIAVLTKRKVRIATPHNLAGRRQDSNGASRQGSQQPAAAIVINSQANAFRVSVPHQLMIFIKGVFIVICIRLIQIDHHHTNILDELD